MTDWRDARLKKALESMPDDGQPSAQVRASVRDFAHRAVAPEPAVPWWRALGLGTRGNRMPWNAAFATVALATLVTVLWRDEEIPGAKPDSAVDRPAPVRQAAPAAPAAPPAPAVVRPPSPEPAPAAARRDTPAPRALEEARRERKAEVAADAMRDQQERALSKAAPAAAEQSAPLESRAAGTAAGPAPTPAPPAAAAAPLARSATATQAFATPLALPPGWTHLRITAQGRTVELARSQAQRLAQLTEAAARSVTSPGSPGSLDIRIEVLQEADVLATLDVAGPVVRWAPRAGPPAVGQASAESLRALQEEVSRLLAR